jgi:vancomycin resistance protein VanW
MNFVRSWVRFVVPLALRQMVSQTRRQWKDRRNGILFADRRSKADLSELSLQAEICQPIMPSALFENKIKNLDLGAGRVNLSLVGFNQKWSFWHYVQEPAQRNGFVVGRNLVNGKLTRQIGGGLCQLSSLMYHLALSVGLQIVERHAHSIDIYQEHERFTPLGADATVVWGFKDFRLTNPHNTEIVFECFVKDHFLTGRVYSRGQLPKYEPSFTREQIGEHSVLVNTLVNQKQHTQTVYVQKQGLGLEAAH